MGARIHHTAQRRGVSDAQAAREIVESRLSGCDPETLLLDQLQFVSLTLRVEPTAAGDIAVLEGAEPRREILGKQLGSPVPAERLVRVEARRDRGLTIVELVGMPGDFEGVRVLVAALPVGVEATLVVKLDSLSLSPALREPS